MPCLKGEEMDERALRLRAAFVFNFCKFVEWPKDAFDGKKAPLVVGIDLSDANFSIFEKSLANKTVQGRPLQVIRLTPETLNQTIHVAYLGSTPADQIDGALSAFGGRPVLTIGDADPFNQAGGVIQFLPSEGRLRYRINLAAKHDDLDFSAKLLQLALVYESTSMRWQSERVYYASPLTIEPAQLWGTL
ncbi:MAG: YfiR family protein [Opitutales bacterium]